MMRIAITILLLSIAVAGSGQQPIRFGTDHDMAFINPSVPGVQKENQFLLMRQADRYNAVHQQMGYLAGGSFHLRNRNESPVGPAVFFHYMDQSVQNAKGLHQHAFTGGYAHHVQLNKRSQLSAGIQMAYHFEQLTMKGLTSGSQYSLFEGFDAGLPLNEPVDDYRSQWLAAGAGVNYGTTIASANKLRIGVSAFNLNRPVVSGYHAQNTPVYYVLSSSYAFKVTKDKLDFTPGITFHTYAGNHVLLSNSIRYYFSENHGGFGAVSVDVNHEIKNATNVGIKLHHPKVIFGIRYTYYPSYIPLERGTGFSLCWKFGHQKKPKTATVPSESPVTRRFYALEKREKAAEKQVKEEKTSISFQLSRYVDFAFNSDSLTPEACNYLDELVKMLKGDNELQVEISGHTDNIGSKDLNRALSYSRARVVAEYLSSKGIDDSRIEVLGAGSQHPLNNNASSDERSRNRRVDIRVYK